MLNTLKQLYENTPVPVIVTDAQLHIQFSNKAAQQFFPASSLRDGLRVMLPSQDNWQANLDRLQSGEMLFLLDASLSYSGLEIVCTPFLEDGKLAYIVVTFAGQRTTALSLSPSGVFRTISAFSNQFRQPLSNIFGLLSMVSNRLHSAEDDSCDNYINNISQNCYQMLRGFSNMTEIIKYNSGANDPILEKVDLWQLLTSTLEAAALLVRNLGIELRINLPDLPAYVLCDQQKIIVAIINLISNSCQYTREKNQITVSGHVSGDRAIVSVADRGLGIPPQYLENVIEPFFSFDPSGSAFAGMGLGIPVVKQIIASHKGTVALQSTELEGTTIAITLPLSHVDGEPVVCNDTSALLTDRFSLVYVGLSNVCRCPSE